VYLVGFAIEIKKVYLGVKRTKPSRAKLKYEIIPVLIYIRLRVI
jgi:hypothetical protein